MRFNGRLALDELDGNPKFKGRWKIYYDGHYETSVSSHKAACNVARGLASSLLFPGHWTIVKVR